MNMTGNDFTSKTSIERVSANYEGVVTAIERKIQVIIKETQKIVERITENFEKKLRNKEANPTQNGNLFIRMN